MFWKRFDHWFSNRHRGTGSAIFHGIEQNLEKSIFFCEQIGQKGKKSCAVMPNSKLHTKFQLDIFIFVARASLRTLLQLMKQKDRKSA